LNISIESIRDEQPLHQALAKIIPSKRLIVVDEDSYKANRGRAHFSIGHELGHWVLYLKKEIVDGQANMFDLRDEQAESAGLYRTKHGMALPPLGKLLELCGGDHQLLADFFKGFDAPAVERAVDTFSAALLMPQDLVSTLAEKYGAASANDNALPDLVRNCAARCEVSKQAMAIRLSQLGFFYYTSLDRGYKLTRENPRDAIQPTLL
jgi:Zn-dependent peptidase ImmA (M78 family)